MQRSSAQPRRHRKNCSGKTTQAMAKLQKTKLQAMVPVREQELVWVLQLQMLLKVLQLRRLQLRRLQLRRLQQLHVALRRLQLHHPPATPRRLQLFQVWQRVLQVLRFVVHIVVAMTLCSTSRCGVRHGQRHKLLTL